MERPVLLYSGGCKFCRWVARKLVKLDVREELDLVPMRSDYAAPILAQVPEEQRYSNWWVWHRGKLYAGNSGGGIVVLKAMTLTRWIGFAVQVLGLSRALDKLDNWVKAKRPVFSRYINDGEAPVRRREEW